MPLQKLTRSMLDVFFPRSCVHCCSEVEASGYEYLCRDCARELILAKSPSCTTCGYPYFGMNVAPKVCPHCAELDPAFDVGKTLFLAKGAARSVIHELKYKSGFYVLKDVRRMIESSSSYLDYINDAILVPVPLHPTKERERGFNQSQKVAGLLEGLTGGRSKVENLLIRTVYTQTQTRLSRSARHQNVKNAFALTSDAVVIPDQTYILTDDVFTTGSTLNACAAVLRKAGAERIKVVTLGHG